VETRWGGFQQEKRSIQHDLTNKSNPPKGVK
jgi:hypothetical protein